MKTLVSLFNKQAKLTPNHIAIYDNQTSITYEDLDKKSTEIARQLLQLNHSSNKIIGICLNRSINLMIGLMGILKAGYTFLLLDPKDPLSRITSVINDSGCPLIVTDKETITGQAELSKFSLIVVDALKKYKKLPTLPKVKPEDCAYLIYTSGSTGNPKGVLCQHQTIINRFEWLWKNYPYNKEDVCCQKAPVSYVDCIWEFFCPLLRGVPYYIISDETLFNPIKLISFLEKYRITRIEMVPSLLKIILQEMKNNQLTYLNFWIVSGEALTPDLVAQFKKQFPHAILLNRYGSTEATSYLWFAAHLWDNQGQYVPIGKPIDNTKIYLLDENLNPVNKGQIGELYVSGLSLSLGYLNDHELTQKKYINNFLISSKDSPKEVYSRLYKTGDLVRELASGDLEYIGRADHQIKIHGYRIEPAEIETIIQQYPEIKEAKILTQVINEETYLVAYYIANSSKEILSTEQLKSYLSRYLPIHFIPNFYIRLEKFPLNKSGKLDRQALPQLNVHSSNLPSYQASNEIEEKLLIIWKEIFKTNTIQLNDNFFNLAGHSLLAMHMIAQIYEIFGLSINFTDIWKYPTFKQLADYIRSATPEKKVEDRVTPSLPATLPLSTMENELWLMNQLERLGGSSYHIHLTVELEGKLNISALTAAFQYLINYYDIFRTNYFTKDGQIYRKISNDKTIEISLRATTAKELEKNIIEFINKPFNLEKDTLIRVKLFKLATNKHVLVVAQHHIISDDWSLKILLNGISTLYQQFIDNKKLQLNYHGPYYQYALWQNNQIQNDAYAKKLDFWKKIYSNVEEIKLITEQQKSAVRTSCGDTYKFTLQTSQIDKLYTISKQNHCTPFLALLSLFGIFVSRYSAQQDITIGVPISLRDNPKWTNIVGILLNCIGVRFEFSELMSYLDVLSYAKDNLLTAFENKDVPFNLIIKELKSDRNSYENPLFNIMFVYRDFDFSNDLKLDNIKINYLDINTEKAKFDLSFIFEKANDQIVVKIEYSTDLFSRDAIARMAENLHYLFDNILSAPEKPVFKSPILSNDSYQKIVYEWNKTEIPLSHTDTIHSLFEQQVNQTPNASALIYQDKVTTYDELNQLANKISHLLLKYKGNSKLVAVSLDRSPMMLATFLAIFKAGFAYIPIGTEFPCERIKDILQQSSPILFICNNELNKKYPDSSQWSSNFITLQQLEKEIKLQPSTNINKHVPQDSLAQIIFTSGSTGKPKGVMLTHRNIVNRLVWMQSAYQLSPSDRFLHKTPYIFDVSVGEIFWPLISGAGLVVAEPELHKDFSYLIELIERHKVSHIHFVPSALPIFLDIIKTMPNFNNKLIALKCIFCSGEALPTQIADEITSALNVNLHNIYGPTESGEVSYYQYQPENYTELPTQPIGKPIANSKMYILDKFLNPVPIGVMGELYIAGECLAEGYFNQPTLTNERFFTHPTLGERLYKTGDIVYWLADGNMVFVQRSDFQVKIRGHRIELEEIERVIMSHPQVKQAVVLVKNINQQQYLIAYYNEKNTVDPSKIEDLLRAQLPDYMIPNHIMRIAEFPLTNSGKIDRKALPTPTHVSNKSFYTPPHGKVETELQSIWQKVLNVKNISIHDNFFSLGGHSLLAIHLLNKINAHFSRKYPLSWVFTLNTIKKQAESIRESLNFYQYHPLIEFNPHGNTFPLIFIHPGRGGAEAYANFANELNKDITFFAVDSYNAYNIDKMVSTIPDLAKLYLTQIQDIIAKGPFYLGGWSLGGLIAYEMACLLKKNGLNPEQVILIDSSTHLTDPDNSLADAPEHFLEYLNSLPAQIRFNLSKTIAIEHKMMSQYEPPSYDGIVTLFQANQEKILCSTQWQSLVEQLNIYGIEANHYSIMEEPFLQKVTEIINSQIIRKNSDE